MTNKNKMTQQEITAFNLSSRQCYYEQLKLIGEELRKNREMMGDYGCGRYDVLNNRDDMKKLIKGNKQLKSFEKKIKHVVQHDELDTSNGMCLQGPDKEQIHKYMKIYFEFESKKWRYSEESLDKLFNEYDL